MLLPQNNPKPNCLTRKPDLSSRARARPFATNQFTW